jgi:hypothetical protein
MIQVYGPDLLRYKGVLWMKGKPAAWSSRACT